MRLLILLAALAAPLFSAQADNYLQQALNDAHAAFRAATNTAMYAEAAAQYEMLIRQDGIRSGHLFYTAGNSWFMAGEVGRAVLNYRRAELYLPADADLAHNLEAALALRKDLIPEKEPHPLAARLLGWHLNTSVRLRWTAFALLWTGFWAACFWMRRSLRKEAKISASVLGTLSALLLVSLTAESVMKHRARPGVITAAEVTARKGDGAMYAPAFLDPLHSGTEFRMLEARGPWMHIELADGQRCWIPEDSAETVRRK